MVPAFANVWAMGFFAYGCELMGVNGCTYFLISLAAADAYSQPRWLALCIQNDVVFVLTVLLTVLHAVFDGAEALGGFELVSAFNLAQVSFRLNW